MPLQRHRWRADVEKESHHTLSIGTIIWHGGIEGTIVSHHPDRRMATTPGVLDGEWYLCAMENDKSDTARNWKIERRFMELTPLNAAVEGVHRMAAKQRINNEKSGSDSEKSAEQYTVPPEEKVDELEATLGDEEAAHQETLDMLAAKQEEVNTLRTALQQIKLELQKVVCTEEPDAGVVLLSSDGPTHPYTIPYEEASSEKPEPHDKTIQVYDHYYFSPLGDALMKIYNSVCTAIGEEPPKSERDLDSPYQEYEGQLVVDGRRGVIYFHLGTHEVEQCKCQTLLRICQLPKPVPAGKLIDITLPEHKLVHYGE
jgi:hypothetical protein